MRLISIFFTGQQSLGVRECIRAIGVKIKIFCTNFYIQKTFFLNEGKNSTISHQEKRKICEKKNKKLLINFNSKKFKMCKSKLRNVHD